MFSKNSMKSRLCLSLSIDDDRVNSGSLCSVQQDLLQHRNPAIAHFKDLVKFVSEKSFLMPTPLNDYENPSQDQNLNASLAGFFCKRVHYSRFSL